MKMHQPSDIKPADHRQFKALPDTKLKFLQPKPKREKNGNPPAREEDPASTAAKTDEAGTQVQTREAVGTEEGGKNGQSKPQPGRVLAVACGLAHSLAIVQFGSDDDDTSSTEGSDGGSSNVDGAVPAHRSRRSSTISRDRRGSALGTTPL